MVAECLCVAILMHLITPTSPGLYGRRQERRPNQGNKSCALHMHGSTSAFSSRTANHLDALRANARTVKRRQLQSDCLAVNPSIPRVFLLACSATPARLTARVGVANRLGFSGHDGLTCADLSRCYAELCIVVPFGKASEHLLNGLDALFPYTVLYRCI